MLTNLIKYDLKFIFKTVNIYILLLLISVILHNLTSYDYTPTVLDANGQVFGGDPDAPVIVQLLHTIFYNAIIAMLIGLVLNAIIRIWARFKYNMYGDESYLTHTLPVSRQALWLSKFLSLVLVILGVIVTIALSFYLLSLTPTGKSLIGSLGINEAMPTSCTIVYVFTIFIEFLFMGLCGITGLILGHRATRRRALHSIIYGFSIYLLSVLLLFGFIFLWSRCDPSVNALFSDQSNNPADIFTFAFITKILLGISLVYATMSALLTFINGKLLARGVDVD